MLLSRSTTDAPTVSAPRHKKLKTATAVNTTPASFQRTAIVAAVETATREATTPDDAASLLADAREILLTDDGASWVYVVPQWYTRLYALRLTEQADDDEPKRQRLSYDQWFDAVWDLHPHECGTIKLYGKAIRTPRYQQAYGVTHRFSGATFDAKPFPDVLQHAITTMQRMLLDPEATTANTTCLSAGLLNWYADGDHYMGPHSDQGVSIRAGSPIFSLTLGPAVRRFVFIPRNGNGVGERKKVELTLRDGDLLVMGGTTQHTHKHALPKMKRCRERRVNVTLRYFK